MDVAIGLMHRPGLLFLDEPTTGMDPQARANLWEHITRLREEHDTTVVLTTHYLDEADAMAERIVVVDHGEVIADAGSAELRTRHAEDRLVLHVDDPAAVAGLVEGSRASPTGWSSASPAAPGCCPACSPASTAPASPCTPRTCTRRASTTSSWP